MQPADRNFAAHLYHPTVTTFNYEVSGATSFAPYPLQTVPTTTPLASTSFLNIPPLSAKQEEKKDPKYWEKREKNNQAAKVSRERRREREAELRHQNVELRQNLKVARETVQQLQQENHRMYNELLVLRHEKWASENQTTLLGQQLQPAFPLNDF